MNLFILFLLILNIKKIKIKFNRISFNETKIYIRCLIICKIISHLIIQFSSQRKCFWNFIWNCFLRTRAFCFWVLVQVISFQSRSFWWEYKVYLHILVNSPQEVFDLWWCRIEAQLNCERQLKLQLKPFPQWKYQNVRLTWSGYHNCIIWSSIKDQSISCWHKIEYEFLVSKEKLFISNFEEVSHHLLLLLFHKHRVWFSYCSLNF